MSRVGPIPTRTRGVHHPPPSAHTHVGEGTRACPCRARQEGLSVVCSSECVAHIGGRASLRVVWAGVRRGARPIVSQTPSQASKCLHTIIPSVSVSYNSNTLVSARLLMCQECHMCQRLCVDLAKCVKADTLAK